MYVHMHVCIHVCTFSGEGNLVVEANVHADDVLEGAMKLLRVHTNVCIYACMCVLAVERDI